ncbi:hypothetical protein JB92DRAFT_3147831 [Gautieria morchelliformis]|nr:hypothetical protein JB92DRAFT_3147831 [Gautieria morchelliformis]
MNGTALDVDEITEIERFTLGDILEFRDYAFPALVGRVNGPIYTADGRVCGVPFFSADTVGQWCRLQPLRLFMDFEVRSDSIRDLGPIDVSVSQLKAYRQFMLPPQLWHHIYFSLDNSSHWVKCAPLVAYLRWAESQNPIRGGNVSTQEVYGSLDHHGTMQFDSEGASASPYLPYPSDAWTPVSPVTPGGNIQDSHPNFDSAGSSSFRDFPAPDLAWIPLEVAGPTHSDAQTIPNIAYGPLTRPEEADEEMAQEGERPQNTEDILLSGFLALQRRIGSS